MNDDTQTCQSEIAAEREIFFLKKKNDPGIGSLCEQIVHFVHSRKDGS
jgi:hypothetical protein